MWSKHHKVSNVESSIAFNQGCVEPLEFYKRKSYFATHDLPFNMIYSRHLNLLMNATSNMANLLKNFLFKDICF
jgi:hypothetical protein